MYKRILVTLDGSALSEAVLPNVKRLVAGTDACVTLLMVAEAPLAMGLQRKEPVTAGTSVQTITVGPKAEKQSRALELAGDKIESYLQEKTWELRVDGIKVESAVQFGDPAQAIIDYAWNHGMELIMMATHGRTGLARLALGSVAGRVIARAAMKPVLLVRPDSLSKTRGIEK